MSFNLTCPSLRGLLFVVSSHNGPQLVSYYPPELAGEASLVEKKNPQETGRFQDDDYFPEDEANLADDGTEWDASHLDFYLGTKTDILSFLELQEKRVPLPIQSGASLRSSERSSTKTGSTAQKKSDPTHTTKPEKILGFEPDYLSEILCPPKPMCNSRFELIVDNTVFLGLPIHVNDDGSWRVSKSKARKPASQKTPTSNKTTKEDDTLEHQDDLSATDQEEDGTRPSSNAMIMFHLVFVMDPLEIERNHRIDEMFYYVTSKLALVLRYEQLKTGYIWSQVRLISRLKEEWRTLPSLQLLPLNDYLLASLSFCKLMADCYKAISTSQIANLVINNKLRSFQIPLKKEFASLPESTVPFIPGSHLSSTSVFLSSLGLISIGETTRYKTESLNNFISDGGHNLENADETLDVNNDDSQSSADDIAYFAILLLDDPETIIKQIKAELHSALAEFIRLVRPTESLSKLSEQLKRIPGDVSMLSLNEMKHFAFHLIYWRCARMIVPISPRAIYIVSPMAPITTPHTTKLWDDIKRFKMEFTTLPSLPQFLSLLSARSRKPKQFASIIPSRDHKDIYLSALAWLIRHGYVTQLHTYIWFKVPRKVKMKVEEELENELGAQPKVQSKSDLQSAPLTDNRVEPAASTDNTSKLPEHERPLSASLDKDVDNLEAQLDITSLVPNIVLEEDNETILVDPGRASTIERRWINKIIHEECDLSPELIAVFFKLLKYMNGKSSLEVLLLKENVLRTELRRLLLAVEDYIISVRHW